MSQTIDVGLFTPNEYAFSQVLDMMVIGDVEIDAKAGRIRFKDECEGSEELIAQLREERPEADVQAVIGADRVWVDVPGPDGETFQVSFWTPAYAD